MKGTLHVKLDVIAIVALEPSLQKAKIFVLVHDNLVGRMSSAADAVSNVVVGSKQRTLLDLKNPLIGRKTVSIHNFKHRLVDGDIFPVQNEEGSEEIVFFLDVATVPEYLAVVDVHAWLLLHVRLHFANNKGLVSDLPHTDVVLQQPLDEKGRDVGIGNGHYFGHFAEGATVPETIQILLLQTHAPPPQLPVVVEDCPLEFVDKLHYDYDYYHCIS